MPSKLETRGAHTPSFHFRNNFSLHHEMITTEDTVKKEKTKNNSNNRKMIISVIFYLWANFFAVVKKIHEKSNWHHLHYCVSSWVVGVVSPKQGWSRREEERQLKNWRTTTVVFFQTKHWIQKEKMLHFETRSFFVFPLGWCFIHWLV